SVAGVGTGGVNDSPWSSSAADFNHKGHKEHKGIKEFFFVLFVPFVVRWSGDRTLPYRLAAGSPLNDCGTCGFLCLSGRRETGQGERVAFHRVHSPSAEPPRWGCTVLARDAFPGRRSGLEIGSSLRDCVRGNKIRGAKTP